MNPRTWIWLLAALPAQALAQWAGWDYDFDQEKKEWGEIQTQIPAYPKPENLRKFEVDAITSHSYFIDTASLSVGEDGVIRYTLLVRTGGGATNVSFEGIRCNMREAKVYAFGHSDGTWARARDPKWRRIEPRDLNGYQYLLHGQFFCNRRFPATLQQINQTLRYGPPKQPLTN
jgi:hypothetical protein